MKYCFLDLETTGFDAEKDSIIEASFIIHDENKQEIERFDHVILPERTALSDTVTQITGITQQEIDKKGVSFASVSEEINTALQGCVIIGHNIDFDIGFLVSYGITLDQNLRIDTHELARIILVQEESYALEILAQKYGFQHHSAHRALSDVEANIELFYFLKDRLKTLPVEFFQNIRSLLETKTDWYAKSLFLSEEGAEKATVTETELPSFDVPTSVSVVLDNFESLTPESSFFIRQGWAQKSADYLLSCAHEFIKKGEKVLIVSPKLDFFPSVKKFPTPGVLFDFHRFQDFINQKKSLSSSEITFYLKCMHRHTLGFRGVDAFDLFFKERDLWTFVCVENEESDLFQDIIQERSKEDLLSLTPYAFLKFSHLSLFKDRILLIDESEIFAEQLLFSTAKHYSLSPYLDHAEEKISMAAQFWVTHFCKEVLEPKLKRSLSRYPEKIAFHSSDTHPEIAESLSQIENDEILKGLAAFLQDTDPKQTRWMHYFPETGHLRFGGWHLDDWKTEKEKLHSFRKIFFYRHKPSGSNTFFRVFLSSENGLFFDESSIIPSLDIQIPNDLVSVKSPEFNAYTSQKIKALTSEFANEESFLVANFSSLETLKKTHHSLFESFPEDDFCVCGEKVMGGDGKLIQKIKEAQKVIFLDQKILHPDLSNLPFKTLVFQKFPFSPPHPIFDRLEAIMPPDMRLWDIWTVPNVTASVSRRLGLYENLERVFWLDPRENSRWGREILKSIFISL